MLRSKTGKFQSKKSFVKQFKAQESKRNISVSHPVDEPITEDHNYVHANTYPVFSDSDLELGASCTIDPSLNGDWKTGRRVVELQALAQQMFCTSCDARLHLTDIESERRYGLGSILFIRCQNSVCSSLNDVKTGKRNNGTFDINSKLALEFQIFEAFTIFEPASFPVNISDLPNYGTSQLSTLTSHYTSFDDDITLQEWSTIKYIIFNNFRHLSPAELIKEVTPMKDQFVNIVKLIEISSVLPVSSVECERGFSRQNLIKTNLRCKSSTDTLDHLMRLGLSVFLAKTSAQNWHAVSGSLTVKDKYTKVTNIMLSLS
ncbi:unnamed protein product [Mytilus edulis]|uniref:Mutator-like transposase domain-containing protein n=1 Tax=Mytilus edulis TaxID=6550 RepID=A0A8S3URL5_MYTED|nr:unnamed protein product [Mytilus edulis]